MQERNHDAMRNAFHAEMRKRGLPVTRVPGGGYKWHSADSAWSWWQVAWEAAIKPEPAAPVQDLEMRCPHCDETFAATYRDEAEPARVAEQHTRGPWGTGQAGTTNNPQRSIITLGPRCIGVAYGLNQEEADANARLFAGSLELLAALKVLVDVSMVAMTDESLCTPETIAAWNDAQDAIAKATGREA